MAKGSIMLQFEVTEVFTPEVTSVPPLYALVFDTLDGDKTTVREIAVEKIRGIALNLHTGSFDASDSGFALLYLVFADRNRPLKIFYAPSHVPSPQIEGAGMAILEVRDFGWTIASPGNISLVRHYGAHAYLDEVE